MQCTMENTQRSAQPIHNQKYTMGNVGGIQICKVPPGTQLCPATFLHIKSRLCIFNPGNLYLLEQINNLHVHHAFLHLGRMFRTRCFLNLGTAQIGLIGSVLVCRKALSYPATASSELVFIFSS